MGADSFAESRGHSDKLCFYRKMSQDEISINVSPPREDLIHLATRFLSSPEVAAESEIKKEAFLKKKGLSEEEIRLAYQRTGKIPTGSSPPFLPPRNFGSQPLPVQPYLQSPFQKFREILHTVALLTGVAYGAYYFIKNIIIPFLFGKPKKPDGVEGAVVELKSVVKESIGQLKAEVEKVHADLEKVVVVQAEQQAAVRNLGDIKSEVATVKGILLSRHQFPSVNLAGSTSIPAWQMAACPDSGDRSSEAEIALPNSNTGSQNSDSSLEMIKEVEVAETC